MVAIIAISGNLLPRIKEAVQKEGAAAGPDILSACTSQNGVQTCRYSKGLALATTSPCAIKSPEATSTLTFASLQVNVASTTATTWTAAKSATPTATTTAITTFTLASGARGTMVASTTYASTTPDSINIFAPSTWLVWGVAGVPVPNLTSDKLKGVCEASFILN